MLIYAVHHCCGVKVFQGGSWYIQPPNRKGHKFITVFPNKMASGCSSTSDKERHPVQQGIEDTSVDYYDIMVIGKTGMGKTSTADKLLVASLDGHNIRRSEPEMPAERIKVENFSLWVLSEAEEEDIKRVTVRLKRIAHFQALDNPHQRINTEGQEDGGTTLNFELISNESTKIRVLDVPGFFGDGDAGLALASADEKANYAASVALGRMRNILQIQATMHMKFRRILYFLPVHGALRRLDAYLETELTTLAKYFGEKIFKNMVVIVTLPVESYVGGNTVTFPESSLELTKKHFNIVLSRSLSQKDDLPEPAFLFISMNDTCETVLKNVKSSRVASEYVTLELDTQICARCASKVHSVRAEKIAVHSNEKGSAAIPYDESTCHPLFIPKHSRVTRFLGGIVYVVSLHAFCRGIRMKEKCIECQREPGSRGCKRVKTKYPLGGQYLVVDHTNNTREPIAFERAGREQDREGLPQQRNPASGVQASATTQRGVRLGMSQGGGITESYYNNRKGT